MSLASAELNPGRRRPVEGSTEIFNLRSAVRERIALVVASSAIGRKRMLKNLWGIANTRQTTLFSFRNGVSYGFGGDEVKVAGKRTQLDQSQANQLVNEVIAQVCDGQTVENLPVEEKPIKSGGLRVGGTYKQITRVPSLGIQFVSYEATYTGTYNDDPPAVITNYVELI